jgi:hypothetical protein
MVDAKKAVRSACLPASDNGLCMAGRRNPLKVCALKVVDGWDARHEVWAAHQNRVSLVTPRSHIRQGYWLFAGEREGVLRGSVGHGTVAQHVHKKKHGMQSRNTRFYEHQWHGLIH